MTSLVIDHLRTPATGRDSRLVELTRRRAVDELGGRTVWCAGALPGGRARAQELRMLLADTVRTGGLDVPGDERLQRLGERLAAMLAGATASGVRLGAAESEVYDDAATRGESAIGDAVRADDIVILHDPAAAVLVQPIRERGAHAVWQVSLDAPRTPIAGEALEFLRRTAPALDAYVVASRGAVAAFIPCADAVTAKDGAPQIGWTSLLADVVGSDRGETVGGTQHVRPVVAIR